MDHLKDIKKGAVINLWHHPKGHNYVVVAEDTRNRKLLLVKLNCFNNDGFSIHSNTRRFHKSVPYTVVGQAKVVKGVTKVIGRKNIDSYHLDRLLDEYEYRTDSKAYVMNKRRTFVCSPVSDNTDAITY